MVLLTNAQEEENGKDHPMENDMIFMMRGGGGEQMNFRGVPMPFHVAEDTKLVSETRKIFPEVFLWETFQIGEQEEREQDQELEAITEEDKDKEEKEEEEVNQVTEEIMTETEEPVTQGNRESGFVESGYGFFF